MMARRTFPSESYTRLLAAYVASSNFYSADVHRRLSARNGPGFGQFLHGVSVFNRYNSFCSTSPEYPSDSDCFDGIVVNLSVRLTTSERRLVAFGRGNNESSAAIISVTSSNVIAARDMLVVCWLSLGVFFGASPIRLVLFLS